MKNQVQLITYVDRLTGGGFTELIQLLKGPLKGIFGGIHVLPFFDPIDGADAGFDPTDHLKVDPRIGNWKQVKNLSQQLDVMADIIVNHVSSDSPAFQDYLEKGVASDYNGLFLTFDDVFPMGATETQLMSIYRPRPGFPLSRYTMQDGSERLIWTTFTPKQIDINVYHDKGKAYLDAILKLYQSAGITMVRLDAAGYAIKKAGTSCFMIPETFAFIHDFSNQAKKKGIEVLVEIHSYFQTQIEIAKQVSYVYDFALPPLLLHALFKGTGRYLHRWLELSPRNCVTVLDTHDGIGVVDIGSEGNRPGLVPDEDIDFMVETIHENTGGESRKATGAAASNLDLYQVNCTYFDALARNEGDYILARAIQFFVPGIPQIYYAGFLAETNDMELLAKTGTGRDINRPYIDQSRLPIILERPVVQRLIKLIRFRNDHPAFQGKFRITPSGDETYRFTWNHLNAMAELIVNFTDKKSTIRSRSNASDQITTWEP